MAASSGIFKLLDEPATVSAPPDAIRLEHLARKFEFRNCLVQLPPHP